MNLHKRCLLRVYVSAVSLIVGTAYAQSPNIAPQGTVNSADYSRTFAPGALISVFGANLASSTQQPTALPLPTSLAGASVQLASNGEALPLWYVSPAQINAQLPYDVPTGQVQVKVVTAAGASNVDTITVTNYAPKIFTFDLSGQGAGVVTTAGYSVLSAANPAGPGQAIVLWMNSMGATTGNPVAGQPAPGLSPGSQPSPLTQAITVTVDGAPANVTFAGLSPGSAGLYQVNVQAPFAVITGPVTVRVTEGNVSSQANVTLPYRQLGFYHSLLGGLAVPGETLNGISGATSALAYQQSDVATWGDTGLNAWTDNTGLGSSFSVVSGLAMTLLSGSTVVYDNNGIETGTYGGFYDNANGPANSQKPGLSELFSMSNYFPLVFAGDLRLAQTTTITTMIGYFDAQGVLALPFDPSNPYVQYRMNIWSNTAGPLPKTTTANFTGDVFSSDTTAGTFSFSNTGVNLISSGVEDAPKPIYRLVYQLAAPLTLPAGEYWFSHDASVLAIAGTSSTTESITADDLQRLITSQKRAPSAARRVSLYGVELSMEDSWNLAKPVTVRPNRPIEQH
jgi:uncharacterized protein (TIGR03437 family)